MDSHTWENYGYDDYFIRYLRINPTIEYDTSEKGMKTYKVQLWLLSRYEAKVLNKDEVLGMYSELMEYKVQSEKNVHEITAHCMSVINVAKKESNDNINSKLDAIISQYNM